MVTKAIARYIRITPRKFRQIIPLIKGKNPEVAIEILMNVNKKASVYAIELLKSAVANARRIQGVDMANLYISNVIANCGPSLKRFRAASMGRASPIIKRTSHITVELDEAKKPEKPIAPPKEKAKVKVEAKVKDKAKVEVKAEAAKKPVTKAKGK